MLALKRSHPNDRQGAMLVLIAFVMIILIVGAVFSTDVAHMHMVRAELRTATDAAARAGAEALARTQDPNVARATAVRFALENSVSGTGLQLGLDDIEIGGWYLSDERDSYRKFQIPSPTAVSPTLTSTALPRQ